MEDNELDAYFDRQLDMFNTPGWKELIEKAKEIREVSVDLRAIKTSEQFHFAKGQMDILDWLLNWESQVRQAIKDNE